MNNKFRKIFAVNFIIRSLICGMCLVTLCAGAAINIFGQKTQTKTKTQTASINKLKTDKQDETTANVKPVIGSRIEVKTGDNPPLLTLVVGQVTTIKLPESPLQIEGDRLGLSISESNENSINKNVYLIPTKIGIRRNLVIELASGKVEFELQSIAVESGKPATFTREVDVRSVIEEKKQRTAEDDLQKTRETLSQKERELQAVPDRIAQSVQTAQNAELKMQTELLFAAAKTKKGRIATSSNKEWEVAEVYTLKSNDGTRVSYIFEVTYRGKDSGRFLEVKSDSGSRIFWQSEKPLNAGEGTILKKGEKIRVAVVEFSGANQGRSMIFAAEGEIIKL